MENTPQRGQSWINLDLKKYGLEYLENKNLLSLLDSDIEKLIDAFASESIVPLIPAIPFIPHNVNNLLGMSNCRRCGKCCISNPITPDHPGVMVLEEDLIRISKHSNYSLKHLKTKALLNTDPRFAQQRYLPLPCMFYNKKRHECQIYEIRPLICKTYPISNAENREGITLDVRCDYGKDIYRKVINYFKNESITSAIENIEL